MNDLRDTCEGDRAADRAASAARTLAAIANDAARKYVKRDAVTPQADRPDVHVMFDPAGHYRDGVRLGAMRALDVAERERQARLRRWHELPHPNRKGE